MEGVGVGTPVPEIWLLAISLGSVRCGAITYIGNGPNFMVKAVAESRSVMPSFGGYIGWTVRYLVPILVAMVCIFLGEPVLVKVIGGVITVFLLLQSFLLWQRYHKAAREVYNLVGSRSPQDAGPSIDAGH